MDSFQCNCNLHEQLGEVPVIPTEAVSRLHRIAEVMQEQGVSSRAMAARLQASPAEVERQLSPSCDLLLSELHEWQAALEVPVVDLLAEPGPELSSDVRRRALLVKVMKTVRSLQRLDNVASVELLVQRLEDQLLELMPELENVDSWPIVGQRRSTEDVSAREQRAISESIFDSNHPHSPEHD